MKACSEFKSRALVPLFIFHPESWLDNHRSSAINHNNTNPTQSKTSTTMRDKSESRKRSASKASRPQSQSQSKRRTLAKPHVDIDASSDSERSSKNASEDLHEPLVKRLKSSKSHSNLNNEDVDSSCSEDPDVDAARECEPRQPHRRSRRHETQSLTPNPTLTDGLARTRSS